MITLSKGELSGLFQNWTNCILDQRTFPNHFTNITGNIHQKEIIEPNMHMPKCRTQNK